MSKQEFTYEVPRKPISLMKSVYKRILPSVYDQLQYWKRKAEDIPDPELRKQALASMSSKQFHCEGGGIYGLLAQPEKLDSVIQFIVAYQTISDYLDNLCDRSVSLDPENFRRLHQSMVDAVSGKTTCDHYYALQENQDDGGYLVALVQACHSAIENLPTYTTFQSNILTLCQYYCDLQVYKHIDKDQREKALHEWWAKHQQSFNQLEWYEFSAATGSTLGIFYYVALSTHESHSEKLNKQVFEAYFPYVQGLHILLDYLIDQSEDREGGDLNFCFYYPSEVEKQNRLKWFVERAQSAVKELPHSAFHKMVVEGLLGIYLADQKVRKQKNVLSISRRLLKRHKLSTWFFFFNGWYIHRKKDKVQ